MRTVAKGLVPLAIATALILAPAAPARAQGWTEPEPTSPAVAAGIAGLTVPLGLVTFHALMDASSAAGYQSPQYGLLSTLAIVSLYLTPGYAGLGALYAGDPTRAAWVGLGGIGASLGGGYLMHQLNAPAGDIFAFQAGALATSLGYSVWAAFDAHATAERTNAKLRAP